MIIECCGSCRSIHQCRAHCLGTLEPEAGIAAKPRASRGARAASLAPFCVAIPLFIALTGGLIWAAWSAGA